MAGPGQAMIMCVMLSESSVQCNGTTYTEAELLKDTSVMFWVYLCVYIILVLFAGEFVMVLCYMVGNNFTHASNFRSDVWADDGSSLS